MLEDHNPTLRIRTTASAYQCECCPPERVCAWACLQGAGVEEIVIGASLALEGLPGGPDAAREALWDSFNAPAGADTNA